MSYYVRCNRLGYSYEEGTEEVTIPVWDAAQQYETVYRVMEKHGKYYTPCTILSYHKEPGDKPYARIQLPEGNICYVHLNNLTADRDSIRSLNATKEKLERSERYESC